MNNGFEFDSNKSETNKRKHGTDFVEIQVLWEDPDMIQIPARTEDQARFLVIGKIEHVVWSVVITFREERIRIISARRSRNNEVMIYES